MKKLLLFLCLIVSSVMAFAQYPQPPQNLGALNIVVRDTGGLFVRQTFTPPQFLDTTHANINNYTSHYPASMIYTTSDDQFWLRNSTATRWNNLSQFLKGDTLFAQLPAFFDSVSHPGATILKILRSNGIVSGGTVTVDSCNTLDVIATIISLNYVQYTSAATRLTVPASDPSLPRMDEVVDSLGVIILRTGTPSSTPVGKPINSATEVLLASYTFAAGASCIGINQIIVYDQNAGTPTEFATSTIGTISADFNNTANPFHLSKAIFVSTYTNGSSLIFTASSPLTSTSSELLKLYIYSNGAFTNQFQISIFNGSTLVGNSISFGTGFGFNPNDSNEYQNVSIPFSAFNITTQTFDKIIITMSGSDISGAKGYYMDWVQLQNGVNNVGQGHGVANFALNGTADSLILTRDDGVIFRAKVSAGSAITLKTNGTNNGSQSILNLKNGTNTTIADDGVGGITINSTASGTGSTNSNIGSGFRFAVPNTNNIKTLFSGNNLWNLDSTTNTNAITGIIDSSKLHTFNFYATNPFNYFTRTGDSTSYTWYPNQTIVTTPPANGIKEFDSSGRLYVRTSLNKTYSISTSLITAATSVIDSLPNKSGIFALTSDLPTTDYQYQTASGSTNYTFTNVPASMNDYMISVNGSRLRQTTDYTTIGNVITIPSVVSGDQIIFQRIK